MAAPPPESARIVNTPDAQRSRLHNASGVRADGRSYAMAPYLTPYHMHVQPHSGRWPE
ncbi:hypothetical protein [Achromobacter xylosoxidans]|uniref:hypothetical protein n=1 Tax=Alcaligenes xylosoxydans xylosoxydans TaxID=85698 RepID=UPI0015C5C9DA|nr:hypothetical protein [Achromobacter xylosoxidans]